MMLNFKNKKEENDEKIIMFLLPINKWYKNITNINIST